MIPFDHSILAIAHAPLDPESAPARAAVVLLSDAAHRPILLATTANARAFLRKRLVHDRPVPDPPLLNRPAPRTDLSSIVARADLTLVGSGLEADLAFLTIARASMPDTWEALTNRWRAWFVHLDPDAPNPVWRKTNLGDLGLGAPQPHLEHLVGPIANKDAAGRCGETIDDLFDLCRFPKELALAPRGTPCAYKEMGRCPAPCEGSEPMPVYRARVRAALALLRLAPDARRLGFETAMRDAANRHDFEAAARHKSRLENLATLARPTLREARPLDTFHFLALLASGRPGLARAWLIDPWECVPIADLDGTRPALAIAALQDRVRSPIRAVDVCTPSTQRPLDPVLLGIIGRHLLAPASKRRGGFLRLAASDFRSGPLDSVPPFDPSAATRLLRAAARTEQSDVEEFDRATAV